tara:strand:- start:674 stop:1432 length:759 start_codon:yes stop_codon:yes gene_type:complete
MAENKEFKFPTETIDLPSEGKIYSKDSPLSSGKIELKYMTAKEEDILTSQNLIKKGAVIDKLLNSLIVTPNITSEDLLIGDKNAVMVAARILAYGGDYTVEIQNPNTGESIQNTFDLTQCEFKELPDDVDYSNNEFELELPVTKIKITFKLLTGKDEGNIANELKSLQKIGQNAEVTTRLKNVITSVNGETTKGVISNFVENMLSKESLYLRDEIQRINPDIDLTQEVEIGGESTEVAIPMTVEFFWPKAGA